MGEADLTADPPTELFARLDLLSAGRIESFGLMHQAAVLGAAVFPGAGMHLSTRIFLTCLLVRDLLVVRSIFRRVEAPPPGLAWLGLALFDLIVICILLPLHDSHFFGTPGPMYLAGFVYPWVACLRYKGKMCYLSFVVPFLFQLGLAQHWTLTPELWRAKFVGQWTFMPLAVGAVIGGRLIFRTLASRAQMLLKHKVANDLTLARIIGEASARQHAFMTIHNLILTRLSAIRERGSSGSPLYDLIVQAEAELRSRLVEGAFVEISDAGALLRALAVERSSKGHSPMTPHAYPKAGALRIAETDGAIVYAACRRLIVPAPGEVTYVVVDLGRQLRLEFRGHFGIFSALPPHFDVEERDDMQVVFITLDLL